MISKQKQKQTMAQLVDKKHMTLGELELAKSGNNRNEECGR